MNVTLSLGNNYSEHLKLGLGGGGGGGGGGQYSQFTVASKSWDEKLIVTSTMQFPQ